jgi:hypothetical protein
MAKTTSKLCEHKNTIQIGTETTVEVYCVDCREVIRIGKTIRRKK